MLSNVSATELINALFIAGGIGVCGLCLLQITASHHIRKEIRNYFQLFFLLIIIYISAHLARQIMDGIIGGGVRVALYIVTFAEIAAAGFMAYMMSMLVAFVARPQAKNRRIEKLLFALFISHIVLLIVSWPLNLIYYFDEANVYNRADGYLLSNLCPIIMLAIDITLLMRFRKNIDRGLKSALWTYMIAPLVAIVLQGAFYGVQLIIFATVGAAVYMFSVIVQTQNKRYEEQRLENSRIESELGLASDIQAHMLPNTYPAFPDRPEFDVYATMTPAREVGGDLYDFFLIDDDHLFVTIADVSGKGIPAALFMMASRIIIASNAKLGKSPAEILSLTNEAICKNNKEEMFLTAWVGVLEISTGKLVAANAGHEYPMITDENGRFGVYKDKHGFIIGGMAGSQYTQYEIDLKAGSKLFVFTDGVTEATGANNELFGSERLVAALNENDKASPEDVLKSVREKIDEFVSGAEQFDDITMLCLEYRGKTK